MSDTTMDQKIELVNQIRQQYDRNRSDLYRREKLLYGRDIDPEESRIFPEGTLRLRIFAACLLFCMVVAADHYHYSLDGKTAGQLFEAIRQENTFVEKAIDYLEKIESNGWQAPS